MVTTREGLVEQLKSGGPWRIAGSGVHRPFASKGESLGQEDITILGMGALVAHDMADHVVVAEAGMRLRELQAHLQPTGQMLPYAPLFPELAEATLGGLVSMNLPHLAEDRAGSWSDWVLGMTFLRPDGTVARSGSRAVKSVAGYDVHHLAIGARGTLGIIVEVILRTATVKVWNPAPPVPIPACPWIQRVRLGDYAAAVAEYPGAVIAQLPGSGLIVADVPAGQTRRRWPGDWVMRGGCGAQNFTWDDPVAARLFRAMRAVMDPDGRLNADALPQLAGELA